MKKALPLTITLGSVLIVFCIILTILWNYILIRNYSSIKQFDNSDGSFQLIMLILGSFFFVVIITGVVLFIVFLARQIILNQLQNNFIDSVTHELKTPLTSIKLYIETMKKYDITKEKKDIFLNNMLKDVERLDILVNHVLDATKIENISKDYNLKEISLNEVIDEVVEIISRRHNLVKENFSFDLKIDKIISDKTALELVIMNLIDNSVKYSNSDLHIEIKSYLQNNKIFISIKDSGVGIGKNEIKKIFNRFYRIPSKITQDKKGTGLGLFIVKENVKNLKGNIEVHSEGLNKGTLFNIILPNKIIL
ncbi:MAG: HAMP domain-containing sensor histidine kinase [Cyanobacteriota bacterium]